MDVVCYCSVGYRSSLVAEKLHDYVKKSKGNGTKTALTRRHPGYLSIGKLGITSIHCLVFIFQMQQVPTYLYITWREACLNGPMRTDIWSTVGEKPPSSLILTTLCLESYWILNYENLRRERDRERELQPTVIEQRSSYHTPRTASLRLIFWMKLSFIILHVHCMFFGWCVLYMSVLIQYIEMKFDGFFWV